jgi:hypothetical protein
MFGGWLGLRVGRQEGRFTGLLSPNNNADVNAKPPDVWAAFLLCDAHPWLVG